MDAILAFKKVTGLPGSYRKYLIYSLDLGDSYAFAFSPTPIEKGQTVFGVTYDIVNKKTGKCTSERFIDNPNKFLKGADIYALFQTKHT